MGVLPIRIRSGSAPRNPINCALFVSIMMKISFLRFLTAPPALSRSHIKNQACFWLVSPSTTAPRRRAERRGECLSRMWLAHKRGTTSASEIGLLATFSGEPIFWKRLLPTAFGKLGGPKTRRAIRLRRGRVRDARKKRQSRDRGHPPRHRKNVARSATVLLSGACGVSPHGEVGATKLARSLLLPGEKRVCRFCAVRDRYS